MVLVVLLALWAACGVGVAAVLQQRAASAVPAERSLRAGLLAALLRRPLWLAGIAIESAADVLQALALRRGLLLVVQALLASSLLFALPLGARLARYRLGWREWLGALAVALGLALFLGMGAPVRGVGHDDADGGWMLYALPLVAVAATLVALSWRRRGPVRAALLAAAAGTLAGLADALTKTTLGHLGLGVWALLGSWWPWALLGVGGVALLLGQSALQAAPLAASLPAQTAAEPVAAAFLGVTLFGDRLAGSGAAVAMEVAGAVTMLAGVVALATSPAVCGERRPGYADPHLPAVPRPLGAARARLEARLHQQGRGRHRRHTAPACSTLARMTARLSRLPGISSMRVHGGA